MEAKGSIFGINTDWKAIVFCLLSACTFWFFNAMNEDHTADVSYPVEFIFNENKRIPVESLPSKVKFNASGSGWNLLRKTLTVNRPPLVVNLDDLSSYKFLTASNLLPLIKAQLNDVKINYVLQDTIYFKFDKLIPRKFNLKIDPASISLVEGYKISGPISIEPRKITIIGPASVVNSIKDSFYVHLPDRGIQADYDERVQLEFDLPELVKAEPEEVKVKFSVTQFDEETFGIAPTLKNFPEGVLPDLKGDQVELTVLIRPEDIDKLKNEDFTVLINYRKLDKEKRTIPVKLLHKPTYVVDFTLNPTEVKIKED